MDSNTAIRLVLITAAAAAVIITRPAKNKKSIIIPQNECGLKMVDGEIIITSWDRWMTWGPSAVQDALHDGASNSIQILSHVLRRAFPNNQWPPHVGSKTNESWRTLIFNLNKLIDKNADRVEPLEKEEKILDNVIPLRR